MDAGAPSTLPRVHIAAYGRWQSSLSAGCRSKGGRSSVVRVPAALHRMRVSCPLVCAGPLGQRRSGASPDPAHCRVFGAGLRVQGRRNLPFSTSPAPQQVVGVCTCHLPEPRAVPKNPNPACERQQPRDARALRSSSRRTTPSGLRPPSPRRAAAPACPRLPTLRLRNSPPSTESAPMNGHLSIRFT